MLFTGVKTTLSEKSTSKIFKSGERQLSLLLIIMISNGQTGNIFDSHTLQCI